MLDHLRIMRLKDRSFLAVWCHGDGCSSHKNRYHSRCSEFNGSCLVLVDLLVSEWHPYTLTNSHGGYWNDGMAHGSDTFEIPVKSVAIVEKESAQARW